MLSLLTGRDGGDKAAAAAWHVVAEACAVREAASDHAAVVATLARGATLVVDERTSIADAAAAQQTGLATQRARRQYKGLLWLRICAPATGWCLASECCVGDGGPLGALWRYGVVCRDGAFVRRGLELASPHLCTLAKDAVFEVLERRVNEQGLARLSTDDGWISEDLNPLSGQRGPIAELLPLTAPLIYRVVLRDGAVVRETVELSSAIVHVVPCGAVVTVAGKLFSDHPAQHCVPRLRLAEPVTGWISQRLNREAPDDLPVVELLGVSDAPLPPQTGRCEAQPSVAGQRTAAALAAAAAQRAAGPAANSAGSERQTMAEKIQDAINAETLCIVCLSAARNATFVHGETGHIACCLGCARALKSRSDTCPVCRTPIDIVIQHFWA
ncbi:hypothetical protein M885DRAFT_530364 [Pelagophyceae sp. CCMP2097]|nr:hypothetical protein M885DRAFT_530364 [Pelagophyceae sp. CCMP2097]